MCVCPETKMSARVFLFAVGAILFLSVSLAIILIITLTVDPDHGLAMKPDVADKLMIFHSWKKSDWFPYVEEIDHMLQTNYFAGYPLFEVFHSNRMVNCHYNRYPTPNESCIVNLAELGSECTKNNSFGFSEGRPCIILYPYKQGAEWVPDYYQTSRDLPATMPHFLKEHIAELEKTDPLKLRTLWLSCEGEETEDRQFVTSVVYNPLPGYPGYYFPHRNNPGYRTPLVAVQFQGVEIDTTISIKCRLWAKNIPPDEGYIRFKIEVDWSEK